MLVFQPSTAKHHLNSPAPRVHPKECSPPETTQPAPFPTKFTPLRSAPPASELLSQHPPASIVPPAGICAPATPLSRIERSHMHPRATPGLAPSCRICTGATGLVSNAASPHTVVYPFSPQGSQHLQVQLQRCQKPPPPLPGEAGRLLRLASVTCFPANRSKMGRSHPPNEQAAIGVDCPINCKGARNGMAGEPRKPLAKPVVTWGRAGKGGSGFSQEWLQLNPPAHFRGGTFPSWLFPTWETGRSQRMLLQRA